MTEKINFATREIVCKIVYYGPGRSGKTTNLEWVHSHAPQDSIGEMVSVATETDRTIFFDFLSLDMGQIAGMTTKFQLYTVPGQVYYNATRKIVLQGADGVIFVADSAPDKMKENAESLANLWENLRANDLDPEKIPVVFQWNKRDLSNAVPVSQMEEALNARKAPSFETVATEGSGVFKALKAIAKEVITKLNRELDVSRPEAASADAAASAEKAAKGRPASSASARSRAVKAVPVTAEEAREAKPPPQALAGAPHAHATPGDASAQAPRPASPPAARAAAARQAAPPVRVRRFRWRLLAGSLGAAALVAVQWVYFWTELGSGWAQAIEGVGSWVWLRYAGMGAVLLAGALLCGLVAAAQDRSVVRAFELGVAVTAVLAVVVSVLRVAYPWAPPAPGTEWREPSFVRMAEVSLCPAILGGTARVATMERSASDASATLKGKEAELSKKDSEIAALKAELVTERAKTAELTGKLADAGAAWPKTLDDAEKRGAERKAAELALTIAAKDREIEALKKSVAELREELAKKSAEPLPKDKEPAP